MLFCLGKVELDKFRVLRPALDEDEDEDVAGYQRLRNVGWDKFANVSMRAGIVVIAS